MKFASNFSSHYRHIGTLMWKSYCSYGSKCKQSALTIIYASNVDIFGCEKYQAGL